MVNSRLGLIMIATGGLAVGPGSRAAAELVFEQAHVIVELPTDEREITQVFQFKNASAVATRITEVRTECDCVRVSLKPEVVGPGQTGEVALRLRARIRNGTEIVRAKVITNAGEVYPLSVTVKLRSYIEVAPHTLRWRKGEPRESKEFIISSTGLHKLRFSKAAALRDFRAEMLPCEDGSTIRVFVTAPPGDRPFRSRVLVTAVLEQTGETKVYDLPIRGE